MKLIRRHIKKFEQFIQNPEDPKEEVKKKSNRRNQTEPEPDPDDEETQDTPENDKKELIDELNEYFVKQKLPFNKWKSTI